MCMCTIKSDTVHVVIFYQKYLCTYVHERLRSLAQSLKYWRQKYNTRWYACACASRNEQVTNLEINGQGYKAVKLCICAIVVAYHYKYMYNWQANCMYIRCL